MGEFGTSSLYERNISGGFSGTQHVRLLVGTRHWSFFILKSICMIRILFRKRISDEHPNIVNALNDEKNL